MLNTIEAMLRTHPDGASPGDLPILTACVEACFRCAETCTACADACLSEPHVQDLRMCIRLNLDCADICDATGHVTARQTLPNKEVMRTLLQACMTACRACGDECHKHAAMHEHCRVCAEVCRACEEACRRLLDVMPV
jgi:hypothetical protein